MSDDAFLKKFNDSLPPGLVASSFLDQGGQGAVFSGSLDGERVAIKLFAPNDQDGRRRLAREIQALREIDCPHLVKVIAHHEVELEGSTYPVVAYEFLPGGDLRLLLASKHTARC